MNAKQLIETVNFINEVNTEFEKDSLKFQGKHCYYEILGKKFAPYFQLYSENELMEIAECMPYVGIHMEILKTVKLSFENIFKIYNTKSNDSVYYEDRSTLKYQLSELLKLRQRATLELVEISKCIPVDSLCRDIIKTNKLNKSEIYQVLVNSNYHWYVWDLVIKEKYLHMYSKQELIFMLEETEKYTKEKSVTLRAVILATGKLSVKKVTDFVEDGWYSRIMVEALRLPNIPKRLKQKIERRIASESSKTSTRSNNHYNSDHGRH